MSYSRAQHDQDPIAELFDALIEEGKPSLVWVVRWGDGGRDPAAAAWQASEAPREMVSLLEEFGPLSSAYRARRAARREGGKAVSPKLLDPRAAERIRAAVPAPPTLQELLSRAAEKHPRPASPIAELMHALESRGAPDPAWLADWSRDGEDPVTAAWLASQDPVPMAHLFVLVRPHALMDLVLAFATLFEGLSYGMVLDRSAAKKPEELAAVDGLCKVLSLRWVLPRELPAALTSLRNEYLAVCPDGHWMVDGPLTSALAMTAKTPPSRAELSAALGGSEAP